MPWENLGFGDSTSLDNSIHSIKLSDNNSVIADLDRGSGVYTPFYLPVYHFGPHHNASLLFDIGNFGEKSNFDLETNLEASYPARISFARPIKGFKVKVDTGEGVFCSLGTCTYESALELMRKRGMGPKQQVKAKIVLTGNRTIFRQVDFQSIGLYYGDKDSYGVFDFASNRNDIVSIEFLPLKSNSDGSITTSYQLLLGDLEVASQ